MSRVQLLGYFGWGNFGDDLFREVCEENADRLWPGADVRAFEGPRQNFAHPRADAASGRLFRTVRGALWANTFAYCGGSVFTEIAGTAALRRHLPGHAVEALGVSVGPFATAQDHRSVVTELQAFRSLIVRDKESHDRLGGNCVLGGDLAALSRRFKPPASEFVSPDEPAPAWVPHRVQRTGLVICPSQASGIPADRVGEMLSRALASTGVEITLLALNSHPRLGDHALTASLAAHLRREGRSVRVVDYGSVGIGGVVDVLARAQLVWSQRLHGAIVSYLLGTPMAIVDHHEKCGAFARDIDLDSQFLVGGFDDLGPTLETVSREPSQSRPAPLPWGRPASDYQARAQAAYFTI